MRILHVNKFIRPVGGAETYVEGLSLRQHEQGHEVALFGGEAAPDFAPGIPRGTTPFREYDAEAGLQANAVGAAQTLWSRRAAGDFERAVLAFAPDVVHFHNYAHQLTSSLLQVCRRLGLAAVHTAHDYKLACPAFVAVRRGHDCFDCSLALSAHLLRDRCLHGSRARSAVAFAEAAVVRRRSLVAPDVIAPSAYMQQALERSWIGPLSTIHLVRHPVERRRERWRGGGGYVLYAGRLSPEKGVDELERLCTDIGIPLLVAGDGPLAGMLRDRITSGASTARLLGQLTPQELDSYRLTCIAQVVPSSWPEVAGLVALEAAALGVPLVLADRGGLPEVLGLGASGVAVDFRDQARVAQALRDLAAAPPARPPSALPASLAWDPHLAEIKRIYDMATAGRAFAALD